MSWLSILLFSLVQGIAEFLPISSSGHLHLLGYILDIEPSLTFDIFLHLSTLLPLLYYFRNQLKSFFSNLKYILVASLPAAFVGIVFDDQIELIFGQPKFLPYFFALTGILLLYTKTLKVSDAPLTFFKAFIIGLFQAVAILPGVSRSTATIFAGMLLGLSPAMAFSFSFFLFIPATLGSLLLASKDFTAGNFFSPVYLIAFMLVFIFSSLSLRWFEKLAINRRLHYFGFYLLGLSLVLKLLVF
ncbi:MAG: undecaprenyl-diphosphate phosphatase [Candidatus Shapirobacteria bacterium]|jgi:undecaprenyl-diphosphatase